MIKNRKIRKTICKGYFSGMTLPIYRRGNRRGDTDDALVNVIDMINIDPRIEEIKPKLGKIAALTDEIVYLDGDSVYIEPKLAAHIIDCMSFIDSSQDDKQNEWKSLRIVSDALGVDPDALVLNPEPKDEVAPVAPEPKDEVDESPKYTITEMMNRIQKAVNGSKPGTDIEGLVKKILEEEFPGSGVKMYMGSASLPFDLEKHLDELVKKAESEAEEELRDASKVCGCELRSTQCGSICPDTECDLRKDKK